jgi:hypothetical protein
VLVPRTLGKSTFPVRLALAALSCALIAGISGCGGTNEQFTAGEADRALAAMDAIEEYVDAGRCAAAERAVNKLAIQSTHVNDDRPDLGEAYASSVARLRDLVARECVEITPTGPTTDVTPSTGATGTPEPTEVSPTDGGTSPPDTPDNGNGNGTDGNNGNNGGANGGGDKGGQNTTPDETPPEDSGGAGPGT